jgi:hypothetical protein
MKQHDDLVSSKVISRIVAVAIVAIAVIAVTVRGGRLRRRRIFFVINVPVVEIWGRDISILQVTR